MRVRCLTVFVSISKQTGCNIDLLVDLVQKCAKKLDILTEAYTSEGYEVQTGRLSFNSFDEWLPQDDTLQKNVLHALDQALVDSKVYFCSLGPARTVEAVAKVPGLLAMSPRFNTSMLVMPDPMDEYAIMHDVPMCRAAAEVCKTLSTFPPGDGLSNFRFCAAFNCQPGIPYYPISYAPSINDDDESGKPSFAVGLENGDLLFLAFHGVGENLVQARKNLTSTMRQALLPVQAIAMAAAKRADLSFGGIDASLAPGLEPRDSVGAPLEDLYPGCVGAPGSVAAVSAITAAIKSLANADADGDAITLCGYSGLMLPVMEDVRLSQRARPDPTLTPAATPASLSTITTDADTPQLCAPPLGVRTLLQLSAVCGVGVDTVPVPGDVDVEALAALYMDVGALALRLRKPLSCRVLPLPGLQAGDVTDVESPFLTNTTVFSI